jgi:NitT/TauT family transport system ATP-binding protein
MTLHRLTIGFLPLLDCAALVVAAEKGFAAAEGLELALVRETSWANIRDRLVVGQFDAAHMLGPMPIASTVGIGHLRKPLIAPMALGLGGNAVTVSTALWDSMQRHGAVRGADPAIQGAALKAAVHARIRDGAEPLTLAMVYPFSSHNYELRYWLAACGIDPDEDVSLVVVPPPFMVDALRAGQIHGFCAGEPWNSLAVEAGMGHIALATSSIWPHAPEKVLGMRADWAAEHGPESAALVRALYHASQWCERPDSHDELAALLAQPRFVGEAAEIIARGLSGNLVFEAGTGARAVPEFLLYAAHDATFPWASHALWFYSQMVRWKQLAPSVAATAAARATYRPDLYREALQGLGVSLPASDTKTERPAAHIAPADVGAAAAGFFDGRIFDPDDVAGYVGPAGYPPD